MYIVANNKIHNRKQKGVILMKENKRRRQEIGEMEMEQIFGGTNVNQAASQMDKFAGFGIGGMMMGFDFMANNNKSKKDSDKKIK